MLFTRNIFFIIILLIIIMLFLTYRRKVFYKGRGYCNIDAKYIKPVFHENFISEQERNYILNKSNPLFKESKLVSGFSENIRKSQTAWLDRDDPVIQSIIMRVCKMTNMPFSNAEKMQVVKYEPNGFYKEHYDASCDDRKECVEFELNGGQRVLTMIIYLNDDFTGGKTHFPKLDQTYEPKKDGGLLFYSLQSDGNQCHPLSLHAGLPLESGNKYIANIWLREKPYNTTQNLLL